MKSNIEYSKGYQAGKKRAKQEVADLSNEIKRIKRIKADIESKQERIFMRSLELTLKHCENWTVGKEPINSAEGFCKLAKIFTDHAINILD